MIEIVAKPWLWRGNVGVTVDEKELIAVVLPKYSPQQVALQYEAAVKACSVDK